MAHQRGRGRGDSDVGFLSRWTGIESGAFLLCETGRDAAQCFGAVDGLVKVTDGDAGQLLIR